MGNIQSSSSSICCSCSTPTSVQPLLARLARRSSLRSSQVFATWEDEPIGCASIGQVHRATLKSTGEKVVVRVQNPDAERTFVGDVFALKVLVDTFMPQLSPAFDEIEKQVRAWVPNAQMQKK